MEYRVKEIQCRTALHFHNSKWLPFKYDINVYRGCAHRCIYCYALYSHDYIDGGNFYNEIYAKTNIADVLLRELPKFSREQVNIGGVTDSYQPAEREYQLMPPVLDLLAKFGVPVSICTKSPLILRDLGILKKVDKAGGLCTAFTITTMDKTAAKLLEPNAPPPSARMEAIREIKGSGITCGIQMMPIVPFITSGERGIEAVFSAAKESGADYIMVGALSLKNKSFFESIKSCFPCEYSRLRELFRNKDAYKEYRNDLSKLADRMRNKYDMPSYISVPLKSSPTQISFF